ncbi:MAG: aminotransferase class IV family protein [Deltaproteobacteria bacterium]|nr:aminotransferase class IV family protein [Deltaproteobacteria bacterium]
MKGLVSINGNVCKLEDAKISVFDRGFLFGDSVFEVLTCFHGKIIKASRHMKRLAYSAEQIGLSLPWTEEDLLDELQSLANEVDAPKLYLRLIVTRGEGLPLLPADVPCNKVIFALPARRIPASHLREGVSLQTVSSSHSARGPRVKASFYLPAIVAMKEAAKKGFSDILWVNPSGEVTEVSTANIFFVRREGDKVFVDTPKLHSGLLRGTTRDLIIGLLNKGGFHPHKSVIMKDQLKAYEEAFISSTVRGIYPVRQIDDLSFKSAEEGSVCRAVMNLYYDWVAEEVGFPVDWSTGKALK